MGKGSGSTRSGSAGSPKGLAGVQKANEEERSIKAEFATGREEAIGEIKSYRAKGKAGDLVNADIDRAMKETEEVLKMYESVGSVSDVNEIETKVGNELRRIAARLDDKARVQQANADDAKGMTKKVHENASSALYMAGHNVRNASNYVTSGPLARLWEIYRSQNKWK